jgi:hypothetical protein
MRRALPGPRAGVVIIDLDYALRRYGADLDLDPEGDLLLIEKKEYDGEVTGGERAVMRWFRTALANSTTHRNRFRGTALLRVRYKTEAMKCPKCGQPKESADEAYARFMAAELEWAHAPISQEDLAKRLLGGES